MVVVEEEATDVADVVVEAAAAAAAAAEVHLFFECGHGRRSESEFFVVAAGAARDDVAGSGTAVHPTAEARGRSH